ncbi:MAG: hypothetical protein H6P95_2486, partial [Candidatus Aminicenantes bacterium]|nr:hypothetical protein [Candidatus Aminicenantes bacterium]
MRDHRNSAAFLLAGLALALCACSDEAPARALEAIRAEDMSFHLKFLGAPEFRGRETPSAEQDLASRYIALTAERIGLKPLMPGGSYYQEVPVEVVSVVPSSSRLRLAATSGERTFTFPADATAGRWFEPGRASGEVVFLGYGLGAPDL